MLVKYHAWPLPKKEITCVQSQKGMKKITDLINKVKLRKMGEKGLPCAPHQLSHLIDIIGGAVQQEKAIKNFFTEILLGNFFTFFWATFLSFFVATFSSLRLN